MEREKKKLKRKDNDQLGKRGFTLLEIMVAMGIFILIVGAVTIFSIRTIEASTRSRSMQNSLDNARVAIETLSKQLRTSYYVKIEGNGKKIFFVDNRNFDKYCYEFSEDHQLKIKKQPFDPSKAGSDFGGIEYNRVNSCDNFNSAFEEQIVVGDEIEPKKILVDGQFTGKTTNLSVPTKGSPDNFKRGFVKIVIDLKYKSSAEADSPTDSNSVIIQSGVSLRDYGVPGVSLDRLGLEGH